jgi:hypothetical protein
MPRDNETDDNLLRRRLNAPSYDDEPYEDDEELPRRDTIMRQRLRAARGETSSDERYTRRYDERYADEEDMPPRRVRPRMVAPEAEYIPQSSGSGCAQATLYVVAGAVIALVIVLLFFNNALNNLGGFFGSIPGLPASGPTSTPVIQASNASVMLRVQQLQRLETTSYTIEQVIEAEGSTDGVLPDWLGGEILAGDRLLLIARGNVSAGIDLRELSEEDITILPDGSTLTVQLPPARIFDVTLDNDGTRVYSRDRGFFAPENPQLETLARQEGEVAILRTACEDGIMQRATEDSQRTMEQFLSLLEFEQVQVIAAPAAPCAVGASEGTSPSAPDPAAP